MPVEFLYFKQTVTRKSIVLSWATATEVNARYFEVERSLNGKDFTPIDTVAASGNSVSRVEYAAEDNRPVIRRLYYRLKEIDFDRQYQYSPVIAANWQSAEEIVVFPNPSTGTLRVIANYANEEATQCMVINVLGNVIQTVRFTGEMVTFPFQVVPGSYIVRVNTNRSSYIQKIVVR